MQKIPLNLAEAGMVLEKPVLNDDGIVLAGDGLSLDEAVIRHLRNAGVQNITVKGNPAPGRGCPDGTEDADDAPEYDHAGGLDLKFRISRLDHLFRKYRENPFMWTLRGVVEHYFNGRLAAESGQSGGNAQSENSGGHGKSGQA